MKKKNNVLNLLNLFIKCLYNMYAYQLFLQDEIIITVTIKIYMSNIVVDKLK